jgi:large subunit ribosomal protein L9
MGRPEMKLILRNDMQGLGKRGDIVDVADGYARNYLLPKGAAIVATPGAVEQASRMRRARDLRDASDREAATTVASTLVPKVIEVAAKAGTEGRLFGSVTAADIVEAIEAQTSIVIDRRQVEIEEQIKTLGQHVVRATLHAEVSFPVTIEVVAS